MGEDISRKESVKLRNPVKVSDLRKTSILDGANAVEVVSLSIAASKITIQMSGTLAGNIKVSIDGAQFDTGIAIPAAGVLASFSSHLVTGIQVNRTAGTGTLTIAAVE